MICSVNVIDEDADDEVDIPRHRLPKHRLLLLFERTLGSAPGRKNDNYCDSEGYVDEG